MMRPQPTWLKKRQERVKTHVKLNRNCDGVSEPHRRAAPKVPQRAERPHAKASHDSSAFGVPDTPPQTKKNKQKKQTKNINMAGRPRGAGGQRGGRPATLRLLYLTMSHEAP